MGVEGLADLLGGLAQLLLSGLDGGDVGALEGLLELADGVGDLGVDVLRQLVLVLLEELVDGVDLELRRLFRMLCMRQTAVI